MIRVCFLWHMHQPFYKDLITGEYKLPWTRMHALKDYFGMVEMLRDFPEVRQTFNLVPSLLAQIEEYASGSAREPLLELVLKPADALSREERLRALRYLFHADLDNLISRYPRYRQLFELYRRADFLPERALPRFSNREITDLQVLSQLAWFDELYLEGDAEIRALVQKGQGYSAEDQQVIGRKQRELIGRITGAYRHAQERGQAELSASPFYHPILPLLCDTAVNQESHAGRPLPRRFRHPDDARLQLERAIAQHHRLFGRSPRGLWPSEGAVSDETLGLARELGFRWAASGEGVLARSLGGGFPRDGEGVPANPAGLYGSYEFGAAGAEPMRLFFRDHCLSDLIGFVYSKMDPLAAAADLLERLRRCGRAARAWVPDPVISVILDGENAWEYYPRNGRQFFHALYTGLSSDPELLAVTFSEAMELPPRGRLAHVVPGSWINSNFDIWIGAEEDNRSWNLLSDARDFFGRAEQEPAPSMSRDSLELAREELLIAEGSDWNWWYGPEHHSANDRDFDELYRAHLANVYRALGASPPEALAVPIGLVAERVFSMPHGNPIHPRLDGLVSSYFEWMGAGIYSPDQRTSAMHGKRFYLREMYYGLDAQNFYLRLDFTPEGLRAIAGAEVRVNFSAEGISSRVTARLEAPGAARMDPSDAEGWFNRVLELRASLDGLGLRDAGRFRFQVVLWQGGLPIDLLPVEGWLEVEA